MDKKLKDEIIKQQGELLYTTLGEECSEVIQACSKIIRKNDANYMILLVLQALGIAIAFVEISLQIGENAFWWTIRYLRNIINL